MLLSVGYWVVALPVWALMQLGDPADQTTAGIKAAFAMRHRVSFVVFAAELALYLVLLRLFVRRNRH